MENVMNPRTKRVREALIKATFKLVSDAPVTDISLTEIAQAAGVSRPTVYKQFNDTASLVTVATVESLDSILATIDKELKFEDGDEYLRALMHRFVDAVCENRDFYRHAIYGPSAAQIMTGVARMLDERMRTRLIGQRLSSSGIDVDDRRAAISAGVVWLLIRWLGDESDEADSPQDIADRIADTMLSLSSCI